MSDHSEQLLEVNEQLVLAMVRTQVAAESAERDRVQKVVEANLRLKSQLLEAENRQIIEGSRLKSEFLSNMSHELRTPLNAIIGFADLLRLNLVPPDASKTKEFAGYIAASGRHLLQLINDVLDLSKIEAGKFEFYPVPVSLPRLVQEVIDILGTSAAAHGLSITPDLDASLSDVVIDPLRLKQILYNFLSNAIKFTPQGGGIVIRTRADGPAHFRLEVEDTGIGISQLDQARLFVHFQQLDGGAAKRHQGTGLGLALTRCLAESQGGSVGVRSEPGQGSVFHVVLSRHGAQAGNQPVPG